jgi:F-type H+-transporting ATPase subunit b
LFYGFVLFGWLMLTTIAPVWAASGQQNPELPAQPAVESPSEEAQNPPRSQAAKTEEQENDQYRHAPIVQSLARLLHMDVETAARTFEIFNVSVVVLGIVIPLVRIMPRLMRKRSEKIQSDLEAARKTTEDANTRLSAVEAKLASLDQEIAKFRAEVEQQIAQDEQRGKAALEEESARIVASAEAEIGVAAAQARRSLRHFAADLAIEQAAKKLVLTAETDRELIAEFVSQAARDGMNSGGKN